MPRHRIYRRVGVLLLVLLLIGAPNEVLWFQMPDTRPVIVQGVPRPRHRRLRRVRRRRRTRQAGNPPGLHPR
jgi:hypothetical protein